MGFIPFNKPHITGKELYSIADAHLRSQLAGDGYYTRQCSEWLRQATGANNVLLTHSCTAALEMAAILAHIKPGDEVIMPSYTFVSTANAFVLRGGVPVFVDIRSDTLNLDEAQIGTAITSRTRAVVPVHYAGIACEMDVISEISKRNKLLIIEDAAQGIMAKYKGRALGSIGQLGAYSFHETKSIISGEGGALLVNDPKLISRAEIIREKGTNRTQFFRGTVDKYDWKDIGSSYLPGEIIAAFLWPQLEVADSIIQRRKMIWEEYHKALAPLENEGRLRRPVVPPECNHGGHLYYLLLNSTSERGVFIEEMARQGINCVTHYVPLHSSPAGQRYGRASGEMTVTNSVAETLVRLPIWIGIEEHQPRIIDAIYEIFKK